MYAAVSTKKSMLTSYNHIYGGEMDLYIYVDILIITNIYADFLLIKATQLITHSPLKTSRACIGAMVGSLFSLSIFLPGMSPMGVTMLKLLSAALVVYAAFGFENKRVFVKRLFIFFLSGFIFGGLAMGFSCITGGRAIVTRNGAVYADFSLLSLAVTSAAAYLCISVYKRFTDCSDSGEIYTVIISDNGRTISFKAMSDTGNILKDSFTGKPVIVCSENDLDGLYGEIPRFEYISASSVAVCTKWRFIPIETVSGKGLIPVIKPSQLCVKNDETGKISYADVYIGISSHEGAYAVFNPKILL